MSGLNRRLDRLEHAAPAPDEPGFLGSPRWWAAVAGELTADDLTAAEVRAIADATPADVPDEIEAEIAALVGATASDDPTTTLTTTTEEDDR